MKEWVSYKNGNYVVKLNTKNGTKIRENDLDFFESDTVESMDIKITNCCNMNCKFCHENSLPNGKHADLTFEGTFLDRLHPYTELAIGGGNPLEHPDFEKFLVECKEHQFIPSMTVNQTHFEQNYDFVKHLFDEQLIFGLGISLVNATDEFIAKVKTIPTAVIHTIAGLTSLSDYEKIMNKGLKVLVLGYKKFRRGEKLYDVNGDKIDTKIAELRNRLGEIIKNERFSVLSFDNLALEQLNVKSHMDEETWEEFYMGDDGIGDNFDSATMYVDMVERKFAKNSCDSNRYDLLPTIEEMYNFLRKKNLVDEKL